MGLGQTKSNLQNHCWEFDSLIYFLGRFGRLFLWGKEKIRETPIFIYYSSLLNIFLIKMLENMEMYKISR